MKVICKEKYEDSRGFVQVLEFKGQEYLLIYTKKGYMRGGEIHRGRQYNVLLQGSISWTIGGKEEIIYGPTYIKETIYAPAYIVTPSNTPHMMDSLTDTLMLEWRELPLEKPVNYYKPFRDRIIKRRKIMEYQEEKIKKRIKAMETGWIK